MGLIDDVYNLGDDVINYQFDISFSLIGIVIDAINRFQQQPVDSDINLRVNTFNIPEISVGNNTINYQGYQMIKPNGSSQTPYTFTFDLRIDKQWNYYTLFQTWAMLVYRPYIGLFSPDKVGGIAPTLRTTIRVESNGKGWSFLGAYPSTVGGVAFSKSDNTPIVVPITMTFASMIPF